MAANRSRQAQGYRFFPHSPSYLRTTPGFGPPCSEKAWITAGVAMSSAIFAERREKGKGPHSGGRPCLLLLLFFPSFFPAALACQCFFHTLLLAGFQIEGVPLNLLDDVFLLYFALETAQSIFEGFPLLQSDFRQRNYTPYPVPIGPDSYCKVLDTSQEICMTRGQCDRVRKDNIVSRRSPLMPAVSLSADKSW